jgi:ribosome-associated protein
MEYEEDDFVDDRPPSKSQLKRDALAKVALGKQLVELSDRQLKKITLPEDLLDAVMEARAIRSNIALKRQLHYIGKVMRDVDTAPIEEALGASAQPHKKEVVRFHLVERWRDRLLSEGPALQKFIDEYPQVEIQQLRQLVRNAQKEMKQEKHGKAYRGLFQLIKDTLDNT